PGRRTHPATSTMIDAGLGDGDPVKPATGDTTGETASAGAAMSTGRGSDRMYQTPAPSNDATTTIASPASSPRESESSRSRRDMRGTLPVRAAPFRDHSHTASDVSAR